MSATICINKVILKGNLGADPSPLRNLPSGDNVCNFSVATSDGRTTEWHSISAYSPLAEHISKSFRAGDLVYLEGTIKTREFSTKEDKEHGRKPRKVTEIVAKEAHLVSKKSGPGTLAPEAEPAGGLQEEGGQERRDDKTPPGRIAGLPRFI